MAEMSDARIIERKEDYGNVFPVNHRMKIRKTLLTLFIAMSVMLTLAACSKNKDTVPTGEIAPKFSKIEQDEIPQTAQILELNNSLDFYTMSIQKDVSCVYFYAVGYDSNGKLIDKSVITTMPVGMETTTELVVNATFPDAPYPAYAVGFLKEDNTHEYYLLPYDRKTGVRTEMVAEKEDFFLIDN